MHWVYFLLGGALGAAATAAVFYWFTRRAILRALRLTERARNREHLMEVGGLAGGLAHEIKNPLSTIKLNLKLLEEEFSGSDDDIVGRNSARLHRLQDEVQRLHNILEDFLRYAGSVEVHAADADLRQVIEELADFFRPQAECHRVVLRFVLPGSPVVCHMDVGLIKQAVLNLMLNATQAMSEGGELLLRLTRQADRAVLEVIDTGPGIPPESRARVFEAYYTTRPGGAGLGLPTTRRIVRLHDGDITVDGEPGKGTRFVVNLPLAKAKANALGVPT